MDSLATDSANAAIAKAAAEPAMDLADTLVCLTVEEPEVSAFSDMIRAQKENDDNSVNEGARVLGRDQSEVARSKRAVWAALATCKRWKPGRPLNVTFLNGAPALQNRVFQQATEWSRYANVTFVRSTAANAQIRIQFGNDKASWSKLGTDAGSVPDGFQTMHFGWLSTTSPDDTLRAVVLHEFGHALGLIHEHQNPGSSIPWDTAEVYAFYQKRGWNKPKVDEQVLRRMNAEETQYSQFDSGSIMEYPIPASLTRGRFAVGWNTTLSATDKAYISCWYSHDAAPSGPCVTNQPRR